MLEQSGTGQYFITVHKENISSKTSLYVITRSRELLYEFTLGLQTRNLWDSTHQDVQFPLQACNVGHTVQMGIER